jgi:hypothetical protein
LWLVVLRLLAGVLLSWLSCRQECMFDMIVVVSGCVGQVGFVAYEVGI